MQEDRSLLEARVELRWDVDTATSRPYAHTLDRVAPLEDLVQISVPLLCVSHSASPLSARGERLRLRDPSLDGILVDELPNLVAEAERPLAAEYRVFKFDPLVVVYWAYTGLWSSMLR